MAPLLSLSAASITSCETSYYSSLPHKHKQVALFLFNICFRFRIRKLKNNVLSSKFSLLFPHHIVTGPPEAFTTKLVSQQHCRLRFAIANNIFLPVISHRYRPVFTLVNGHKSASNKSVIASLTSAT